MSTTDTITNLDPALEYDLFSGTLVGNVFDTLYTTTPTDGSTATHTVPLLADGNAVAVNGNTSVWQVKLKANLKFSNGDPITAQDVKFSFLRVETINDPESASFYFTQLMDRNNLDQLITCPDGPCDSTLTVKFQLNQSYSIFPNLLTFSTASVLNHKVFSSVTQKITGLSIPAGAGSGPYTIDIANSNPTSRIALVANPNYNFPAMWKQYAGQGAPAASNVPVARNLTIFIRSGATNLKSDIQTRQVDLVYRSLNPQDVKSLQNDTTLSVKLGTSPQIRYLVFNVKTAPFDDLNVRKAIAYMVDRQQIVDTVFQGLAQPLWSMIPPGWDGHKDVYRDVYGTSPNVQQASQLLTSTGHTLPIKLDLWYPTGHYGDTDVNVAQVLKSQLEQGNVFTVTLHSNAWSQYTQQFSRGQLPFFLLGWFPDFADTDNYITPFLTPGGGQSLGSEYNDSVMTRLIANETGGPTSGRPDAFSKIQDKLATDLPYLPLWQTGANAVFTKDVSGVILDPFLFRYYFIGKGVTAQSSSQALGPGDLLAAVSRE